jgi:hypothetical protein
MITDLSDFLHFSAQIFFLKTIEWLVLRITAVPMSLQVLCQNFPFMCHFCGEKFTKSPTFLSILL